MGKDLLSESAQGSRPTAAVLMAVYENDLPEQLSLALEAIVDQQTRKPDLVFVVQDGPLSEALNHVLDSFSEQSVCPVERLALPENVGLSMALRAGAAQLKGRFDFVIRTDADDISRPDRIAEQIDFMVRHPEIGLASSQVAIFEGEPQNRVGSRHLPITGLSAFARSRTPINHSAAIFRDEVLAKALYPETRLPFEDWWISLRVLQAGWQIGVIDQEHLDFRGGENMIERRSGLGYAKKEIRFFRDIHAEGLMPTWLVAKNLATRIVLRLMPTGLLQALYKRKMHR